MLTDNKRVKSAKHVGHLETIFACPICHSSMAVSDYKSLICSNYHTFDFAKQGYINLTTHAANTKYSKELFAARRRLLGEGAFFKPLSDAIATLIQQHAPVKTKDQIFILDTGCGEGTNLSNICDYIGSRSHHNFVGVGIDLAKEGIIAASKDYADKIWAVADLTNTPFKNEQFDVILNILSPSNYAEFKRVLKPDGMVIKVVPQSGYLKELREHLFQKMEKQNYSNIETVERFDENFQFVDRSRLTYTVNLQKPFIQSLVQMTPLTWAVTEEQLTTFINRDTAQITVDLDILIAKNTR